MSRLEFSAYRDHLAAESRRFRDVLADCDPAARVPGCPDWDAADLLWHLTGVQHFWASIINQRPTGPESLEEPVRPEGYGALLEAFDTASSGLVAALDAAEPGEVAWSWAPEQTVGFTFRRQAHEALIHRLDAEQTAGEVTPLDTALAADGVDEALAVMFGGCPDWGTFIGVAHFVRVDLTDTHESIWVELGQFTGTDPDTEVTYDEPDISVVPAPAVEADAVVSGTAAELDAWLWRRGDDENISVTGNRDVYDRFRAAVNNPIN
ncbi:maleylpyruvate isomerase family mycothiol-dependent enzyme [Nocardioides sp.]|uniref:maleylpyruvate isomerase family mycothiol-dependent enzyme n=1 Tax=Nocardioides sp. TaxID=35761 RepID=UPI003D110F42